MMHSIVIDERRRLLSWPWIFLMSSLFAAFVARCAAIESRKDLEVEEMRAAAASVSQQLPDGATAEVPPQDFVLSLPSVGRAEDTFQNLQRRFASHGVGFVSFTAKSVEPAVDLLGKTELSLSLQGRYAPIKDVIADLTAQPGVILRRVAIRRRESPVELDAQLDATLLSRPVMVKGR